jgi:hypothetical protein
MISGSVVVVVIFVSDTVVPSVSVRVGTLFLLMFEQAERPIPAAKITAVKTLSFLPKCIIFYDPSPFFIQT